MSSMVHGKVDGKFAEVWDLADMDAVSGTTTGQ
jgi:hypothetical protein